MKQFVLYDSNANIYAGLEGHKIIAVDSPDSAVHFDSCDNSDIKCCFYNAVTGANFKAVEI
jgi:hypothetical protein